VQKFDETASKTAVIFNGQLQYLDTICSNKYSIVKSIVSQSKMIIHWRFMQTPQTPDYRPENAIGLLFTDWVIRIWLHII